MISMDRPVALVLSGGGARGAYEVGVWQALREMNVEINLACGTSVGAINSALIAQGSFDTAVSVWKSLENHMIFDLDPVKPHRMDFDLSFDNIPLSELGIYAKNLLSKGGTGVSNLKKLLTQYINEEAVRKSPIDFGLVTAELPLLNVQRLFIDHIPPGKLVDFIIASASCFPAAQAYTIGDSKYVDGAYKDNMPVAMALDKGFSQVIAVDLDAAGIIPQDPLKEVSNLIYIRSPWDLGNFLYFDGKNASHIMRLGYLDTLKSFKFYDGNLYAFSKGSISKNDLPGAEAAGKIFALSPIHLYTGNSFNHHLKGAVQSYLHKLDEQHLRPKRRKRPLNFLYFISELVKKNLGWEIATIMIAEYIKDNPDVNFFSDKLSQSQKRKGFTLPLLRRFTKKMDEAFLSNQREAAAYLVSEGII